MSPSNVHTCSGMTIKLNDGGAPVQIPCNHGFDKAVQICIYGSSNSMVESTNAFLYQFCICQDYWVGLGLGLV